MTMYWKVCVVVALTLLVQVFGQRKKLGGWNEAQVDSPGVQKALTFAQEEFNRINNDRYIVKINRTIKVMRQVVAGTKYKMEVEVAMGSGKYSDTKELTDEIPETKKCTFEVLIVPWQNVQELRNSSCR